MKKYLPSLLLIVITFFLPEKANGQFTSRQAGLRLGYRSGIFYQAGTGAGNAEVAYNAMISFQKNGIQLTGMKIIYESSFTRFSPEVYFSWGYGGHLGYLYSDHVKAMGEDYYFNGPRFCPLIGVDGWLSAEYRLHQIPLVMSLNYKPFIELTVPGFIKLTPWDFALSVSYVF
ncbi:MAG TPA: hypothetical protein VMT63_09695 [Bacteroidales bacterium]|nr:hypothetical protein [Bacteroidales bacterium]